MMKERAVKERKISGWVVYKPGLLGDEEFAKESKRCAGVEH